MRVLIIEDDQATLKTIQVALKSEGFVCDSAEVGEDGLEIARHYEYDLILLDLMLPDIDGYEILRRLRAVQVSTPVLILSGLSGIDDKIKGLGVGADDYLTKPFNKDELIARVRAIIRRSKGHPNSVITVGRLTIDLNTKMLPCYKSSILFSPSRVCFNHDAKDKNKFSHNGYQSDFRGFTFLNKALIETS